MGKVANFFDAQGIPLAIKQEEQMRSLDRKFSEMEAEITVLQAEVLHLEAQVNPLQREIDRYKKQLELQGDLHLHEVEEKIMKLLCKTQKAMFAGEFSTESGISVIRIRVFLGKLKERNLVREKAHWQGGTIFSLTDDGATYAVEHGWA